METGTRSLVSDVPHSLQNLPELTDAPQFAQMRGRAAPHWLQNFAPGTCSWPHAGHAALIVGKSTSGIAAVQ
jgi:hypothetical protein